MKNLRDKHQNKKGSGASIWCLEKGSDRCDFCFRCYHIEDGYFCTACDRPVCPFCAVMIHEENAVYCPECHEERGKR